MTAQAFLTALDDFLAEFSRAEQFRIARHQAFSAFCRSVEAIDEQRVPGESFQELQRRIGAAAKRDRESKASLAAAIEARFFVEKAPSRRLEAALRETIDADVSAEIRREVVTCAQRLMEYQATLLLGPGGDPGAISVLEAQEFDACLDRLHAISQMLPEDLGRPTEAADTGPVTIYDLAALSTNSVSTLKDILPEPIKKGSGRAKSQYDYLESRAAIIRHDPDTARFLPESHAQAVQKLPATPAKKKSRSP